MFFYLYLLHTSLTHLKLVSPSFRLRLAISHLHSVKTVQIRSFFWSVFSRTWNEYGDLRRKSLYLVQKRENTDQKKLRVWTFFVQCMSSVIIIVGKKENFAKISEHLLTESS